MDNPKPFSSFMSGINSPASSSMKTSGDPTDKFVNTIMERSSLGYTNMADRPPPTGANAGCSALSTIGYPAA
ncbi:hypothetical protein OKW96_20960 [Sphingobacterium sp. KU25419]|nr:hypothetical protein OKW96_20960 [Sphingobacterium sp. KU25419]